MLPMKAPFYSDIAYSTMLMFVLTGYFPYSDS